MNRETEKDYLVRRIQPDKCFDSLLEFPSYFEIETVNACNARCPMCTIEDWHRSSPVIKDGLFEKISSEICGHSGHVKRVSLYRDGEPLLDKKLANRINVFKEGGIQDVSISTNGALLTEDKSRDLLEAGLDTIILSIDSLQKEIFESIRVRLVFEEVLENALNFISLRDKLRSGTKVWVRMVRQEENYDEWPSFEKYWLKHLSDQDRVNYHNVHNWGGQLKGFKAVSNSHEKNLPCVALWGLMIIFSNGDVPLCNVDYNNKYPTGSVLQDSIADVWQSSVMEQRREHHLSGEKAKISLCENCNVWEEPPDLESVVDDYIKENA